MSLTCELPADARVMARTLRRWILERSIAAGVGHIGSALSVADIMAVLWGTVLRKAGSTDPDRDTLILCKGHSALALYAAMHYRGIIDAAQFASFCQDGSPFGAHPEVGATGIEVGTGSLGQGLSVACGLALARRSRGSSGRTFALVSDAECNEGQVWEAAQFAAHHRLDNLTVIVDLNGMQAMGKTEDILDMSPMSSRWSAFGWHAADIDGHDVDALKTALSTLPATAHRPTALIAHTQAGKGVSFMENRLDWHYRNLTPELAGQALAEVEASAA